MNCVSPLYVIAVISNPQRFKSRYHLYEQFANQIANSPNAVLYTVEIAFGERPFTVTSGDNTCHVQLRGYDEAWHKENMINIGISRLPADWKYVAWIDADVMFTRTDWAIETVQQLQHYAVVQMFSEAIELGPNHEVIMNHQGFAKAHFEDSLPISTSHGANGYNQLKKKFSGSIHHPGYAWAIRRETLDGIGGLIDYAILGSGDWHMACAFANQVHVSFDRAFSAEFRAKLKRYETLCRLNVRRNVGFVPQTILHYWHGKKKNRGYDTRWKLLRDINYNPDLHLVRDSQGLINVAPDADLALRDGLRRYFRSRDEDSIDL